MALPMLKLFLTKQDLSALSSTDLSVLLPKQLMSTKLNPKLLRPLLKEQKNLLKEKMMNPYLQEILHQISLRLADLEVKNKMLEAECAALREQVGEHDRNFS